MMPVNRSIFSCSLRRRISLTLPSTPAASSARKVSDLALAEQSALGVDLLGGEDMSLDRWLGHYRQRAGQKGHVRSQVWFVGNVAFDAKCGVRRR